jgi:hypothetical protein
MIRKKLAFTMVKQAIVLVSGLEKFVCKLD